jgi:L-lactate dehydrogenase complex protein LldG
MNSSAGAGKPVPAPPCRNRSLIAPERTMMTTIEQKNLFIEKARAASAVVMPVTTMQRAWEYAVEVCGRMACKGKTPVLAAPGLPADDAAILQNLCDVGNIQLLKENLRGSLQAIDVGLSCVDLGIAETGTLLFNAAGEDKRLASMVSDIHLVILPASGIRLNDQAIAADLRGYLACPENYTTFITGPSRTADIERVLAIGAHGPLELHILLVEDEQC